MIENPEAVGNPDETPIVTVTPGLAAWLERTQCGECGLVNHQHSDYCSVTLMAATYRGQVIDPLAREVDRQIDGDEG